ncbi:MAG: sigma-70 family RNA polymerase sigma factor [Spirochaetota bacterium]
MKTKRNREYDPVDIYIRQIKKIPVMPKSEEQEVARRAREGDERAKELLITSNLRFVVSFASRYQKLGVPLMDLINEGNMGLMRAAEKFDPERGIKFISYARWWIRHYMLKAVIDQSGSVRVRSRSAARHQERERPGTGEMVFHTVSLDQKLYEGEGSETLIDTVEDTQYQQQEQRYMEKEFRKNINQVLAKLKPIERTVINWHFGLNGNRVMALREIGERLNLTKERIRQIEQAALEKLRYPMEETKVVDFIMN